MKEKKTDDMNEITKGYLTLSGPRYTAFILTNDNYVDLSDPENMNTIDNEENKNRTTIDINK